MSSKVPPANVYADTSTSGTFVVSYEVQDGEPISGVSSTLANRSPFIIRLLPPPTLGAAIASGGSEDPFTLRESTLAGAAQAGDWDEYSSRDFPKSVPVVGDPSTYPVGGRTFGTRTFKVYSDEITASMVRGGAQHSTEERPMMTPPSFLAKHNAGSGTIRFLDTRASTETGWRYHRGLDIYFPSGAPVYAPFDGTVVRTGILSNSFDWGDKITIRSSENPKVYAGILHAVDVIVQRGQQVVRGQQIASNYRQRKDPSNKYFASGKFPGGDGSHIHAEVTIGRQGQGTHDPSGYYDVSALVYAGGMAARASDRQDAGGEVTAPPPVFGPEPPPVFGPEPPPPRSSREDLLDTEKTPLEDEGETVEPRPSAEGADTGISVRQDLSPEGSFGFYSAASSVYDSTDSFQNFTLGMIQGKYGGLLTNSQVQILRKYTFEGGVSANHDGEGNERAPVGADFANKRSAADLILQIRNVLRVPPVLLMINPESLSISRTKVIEQSARTIKGYPMHTWGDGMTTISGNLKFGGWYATGPVSGNQRSIRKNSAAYQQLFSLLHIYRNNGYFYDRVYARHAPKMVGAVSIEYDGFTYIGFFQSFAYSENADTSELGALTVSFTFLAYRVLNYDRGEEPVESLGFQESEKGEHSEEDMYFEDEDGYTFEDYDPQQFEPVAGPSRAVTEDDFAGTLL